LDFNNSDEIIRLLKRLVPFALVRIDKLLVSKLDPEDIIQSVFGNFYEALQKGSFKPASWEEMWFLLAKMTLYKISAKKSFFYNQTRDVRLEKPIETANEVPSDQSIAEEKLILEESLDFILKTLEDESKKKSFLLTLRGHSPKEIAEELGLSKRTVERFRSDIRDLLTTAMNS